MNENPRGEAPSFSARAKGEMCRVPMGSRLCAQAEAYGALLFCNSFGMMGIRISTQSEDVVCRLTEVFRRAFDIAFEERPENRKGGKRILRMTDRQTISRISERFGYDQMSLVSHHINYAVLEEPEAVNAFCRGAFLVGGSVTDPAKRYHLEVATSHLYVHREFQALLHELHLQPRTTTRKSNYLTYFKKSEAIAAFLTDLGASEAAERVRQARKEKNLVNGANRQYNCDVANVDKAVAAAQTQIEAIRRLRERGELEHLPEKLRETAEAREQNPELSLAELAGICVPPVSKSCLNHRLRKLQELAGEPER